MVSVPEPVSPKSVAVSLLAAIIASRRVTRPSPPVKLSRKLLTLRVAKIPR